MHKTIWSVFGIAVAIVILVIAYRIFDGASGVAKFGEIEVKVGSNKTDETTVLATSGTFDVPASEAGYIWRAQVEQFTKCDFTALGKWSFGAGMVDAGGKGAENKACAEYHDGNCPSKTSKLGVLVAKDGEGVFRHIGASGRLYVNKGDEIFFTINDVRGTFADNSGRVTVKWECYKI